MPEVRSDHPKPCPICGKPAEQKFRPFCSRRCANVDLNRWFTGSYAVPTEDQEIPDADEPRRDPDDPPA